MKILETLTGVIMLNANKPLDQTHVLVSSLAPGQQFYHPNFKNSDGTPEVCLVLKPCRTMMLPDGAVPVVYIADGQVNWVGGVVRVKKI